MLLISLFTWLKIFWRKNNEYALLLLLKRCFRKTGVFFWVGFNNIKPEWNTLKGSQYRKREKYQHYRCIIKIQVNDANDIFADVLITPATKIQVKLWNETVGSDIDSFYYLLFKPSLTKARSRESAMENPWFWLHIFCHICKQKNTAPTNAKNTDMHLITFHVQNLFSCNCFLLNTHCKYCFNLCFIVYYRPGEGK